MLAYAGLRRLGRADEITESSTRSRCCPRRRRARWRSSAAPTTTTLIAALAALDHADTPGRGHRRAGAARRARGRLLRAGRRARPRSPRATTADARSFPTGFGDRDRRQCCRSAVGHRPDHRCRRSRAAACRRPDRRRRRSDDGELDMTRARKVRRPRHLRRCRPRRPGAAGGRRRRGAATRRRRRRRRRRSGRDHRADARREVAAGRGRCRPRPPSCCSPRRAAGSTVVRLVAGDPFADDAAVKEAAGRRQDRRAVRRRARRPDRHRHRGLRRRPGRRGAHRGRRRATSARSTSTRSRTRPGTLVLTVDAADVAAARRAAGGQRPQARHRRSR